MDPPVPHNNYQTRGAVPHLASMPTLPNCPTFSSLLSKDYGQEAQHCNNDYMGTCPRNDFITRKRSFYVLATMLVLGIIMLIFIVVGGTIAYVQHTQQLALRPTIKNKICERTYCAYGAQCNVDEYSQQPYCRCEETCPDIHQPVCGTDGHNYINECQLRLASCTQQTQIYVKENGPCGLDPCQSLQCRYPQKCKQNRNGSAKCVCSSSPCPQIFKPVCGSDGVSYDSECDLHRQSCLENSVITIKHDGLCLHIPNTFKSTESKSIESKSTEFRSPCHKNKCWAHSDCVVRGEQAFCECPQCTHESKPVCGTDHKTYSNDCELRRQSCLTQSNIEIAHYGYCERCDGVKCHYYSTCQLNEQNIAECVCPQVCIRVDQPVCGNNGITYENECELKVASCRLQTQITVKFNGSCDLCHRVSCKYGAKCVNGQCVCPVDCPADTFEPLCANDGNTYNNDCEMKKAACRNELELIALFYGECEEVDEADNTIEGSGFGDSKITTGNGKPIEIGSGMYMSVGLNPNPKHRHTCENMNCQFGAKCKYNQEGTPYCACQFDCFTQMKQKPTTQMCGSDGRIYESECMLKEEACKRQVQIHTQDKHLCNGLSLHLIPCNGGSPVIDPNTGDDMKCDFGDNDCPLNSYCHKTETFAVCCPNLVSTNNSLNCQIDPTNYKCLNRENTKLSNELDECECNKHGSYSLNDKLCNPITKQCNCKSGVGGLRCDRCEPGFWGLHKISEGNPGLNSGCMPCSCNKFGSVRDDCEQMTGRCVCKHGINGMKCDVCPEGSVLHADGCTDVSIAIPVLATCKEHKCFNGAVCREKGNHSICVCDFNCANDKYDILSTNSQIAHQPVCGSDGSTHMSECHLKLHSCRFQKPITVIHENSCTDQDLINVKKKKRSLPKYYQKGEHYVRWKSLMDDAKPVSLLSRHEIYYFDGNNFLKYFVKPTSISSPFMLSNKMTIQMWFLSSVLNGICFYYNNSYKIGYTTLYWSITISLVDGFAQMKVDIVSIMTRRSKICDEIVTSGQPIKISEWNHLNAEINLDTDSIEIQMNSGPLISRHEVVLQCFGLKPAAFNNIKAIGAFYIGGAPILKEKNFEGAIKQFSINGFEIR